MDIKQKLKNRKGFTLAETLMAVLILLMVSVIVAGGIPVAKNAYEKVVLTANAQTFMSTVVNTLRDELGTAWDVRVDDKYGNEAAGTSVTFFSADTGARSRIFIDTDKAYGDYPTIAIRENAAVSGLGVTDNATVAVRSLSSDHLFAEYTNVRYDQDNSTVTFSGLKIKHESGSRIRTLVTVDEVSIRVFSEKQSS